MSTVDIKELGVDSWGQNELSSPFNVSLIEELVSDFSLTLAPGDSYSLYLAIGNLLEKYGGNLNNTARSRYQLCQKKLSILAWYNQPKDVIK